MPNRIVREGILTSDRVNSLSPHAELFYRRLMSVVDDYGRFPANPMLLRASCYPLKLDSVKEDSISKHLAECVDARLIVLFTVAGKTFLELQDFRQQIRAKESKYPAPDGDLQVMSVADVQQMRSRCAADDEQMRSTCIAYAHLDEDEDVVVNIKHIDRLADASVDTLMCPPVSELAASYPTDRSPKTGCKGSTSGKASSRHAYSQEFEDAWREYPKRDGDNPKLRAYKAWQARIRHGYAPQLLTDGVKRYAAWCAARGKLGTETVKQAATFFSSDESFLADWDISTPDNSRNQSAHAGTRGNQENINRSPIRRVLGA